MCFSLHVEKKLNQLSETFEALSSKKDFAYYSALKEKKPEDYMAPDDEGRIYPYYWSPVIVKERGHRIIKPMRYRLRPQGSSEEVPNKFNIFNARLDSLESRKTWKPLLGKRHCLIPIRGFYEWVATDEGKKQIEFYPPEHKLVGVAGLYDIWQGKDHYGDTIELHSFAVITQDPPPEVEEMGHDRCPIVLNSNSWDQWLETNDPVAFLGESGHQGKVIFQNQFQ
jgi:putative SOS response-associated peptidase YedK